MDLDKLTNEFKVEVNDRAEQVDPGDEYCWLSLTAGWALGKGLSIDDAETFSHHIRYDTDLG